MDSSNSSALSARRKRSLRKLKLNKIHKKRKCYVILVVEKTSYDLEKLLMIRYHSECDIRNAVKFISLNDIYDFIISYEVQKLFMDDAIKFKLTKCCDEARFLLKKGCTIPYDLLAKIIKLRMIIFITNDIYEHKYPSIYDEDYPSDVYSFKERSWTKRRVKFRQLYIILIQFYSPKIIPALYQTGLSINAIVEFGEKDDDPHGLCFDSNFHRPSDIFRQQFWLRAPILYYQYHTEEPIRLVYNPHNFVVSRDNAKAYKEQCRSLYTEFLESIDIDKIKKMQDVLIHRLGFYEIIMAQIEKENYDSVTENEEVEEVVEEEEEIVKVMSYKIIDTSKSYSKFLDTSSVSDYCWEQPFVKRVTPEMDLDSRKRFTRWPDESFQNSVLKSDGKVSFR